MRDAIGTGNEPLSAQSSRNLGLVNALRSTFGLFRGVENTPSSVRRLHSGVWTSRWRKDWNKGGKQVRYTHPEEIKGDTSRLPTHICGGPHLEASL